MRILLFFLIALAVAAPFNFIAIRALLRVHPRRKVAVIAAAVIGNLMWLCFPLLPTLTAAGRVTRAIFGPPWFAWTCFAIIYSAFVAAIAILWMLFRRIPFPIFARWPSRVFLALTIIGSVAGFYEAIVPLRVERVVIYLDALPSAAEGTRIALLADLHVGIFTRASRLRQFFETTEALRPDIVILAGDLVDDDPYFTPKLLSSTRFLDPHTPLLAVLGNHEMYGDPDRAIAALRGSRIRLLVNEGANVGALWIAGLSDYAAQTPRLKPNLAGGAGAKRDELSDPHRAPAESFRRAAANKSSADTCRAHSRRPTRHPPSRLVAGGSLSPLSHGLVSTGRVAALRQHRHRILARALPPRHDRRDHVDRAARFIDISSFSRREKVPRSGG
ncbi:MAG TPA: metallophosphoesterase [Thermoanaerobaculia bacterium]|nr:metallophosphoesterase [Thermoanaerobaculia bacterium]